jgi:hypothetical protein
LPADIVRDVLELSETIGFTDFQDIDSGHRLYFNGNVFRRNSVAKIKRVLDALSSAEQIKLLELESKLQSAPCISDSEAIQILGPELFKRALGVGLFDSTLLSNNKEEVRYVSRPSTYSKFGNPMVEDALDLAKAFVGSLTYGMTRSSYERGQITMLSALMRQMIAGNWVGPVAAIGQDYKILKLKGVVEVKYFSRKGRYGPNMRLLKREIGELALKAIQSGDVSVETLPNFPGATVTKFRGPEDQRAEIRRRAQVPASKRKTDDMLMALRTGAIKGAKH